MPKPACVPCQRFFRPKRNGYYCTEMMPEHGALPGTLEPHRWHPYKIWAADLYECEGCGAQIVVGWSGGPLAVQHEPNFLSQQKLLGADQLLINDC